MPLNNKKLKKKKKEEERVDLKEKITEMLDLPKEIVLNVPKMTVVGNSDIIIENYRGIIEYDTIRIRVNTAIGIIKIYGTGLSIKAITSEDIIVSGEINQIEILK
jgi:sporulation protein YqfC